VRGPQVFAKHSMLPVSSLEDKHGPLDQVSKKVRRKIREQARERERLFDLRLENNRKRFGARTVTRGEASQHNKRGDLWLVISGVVYNVSEWIGHHPGGEKVLLEHAGKDATTIFKGAPDVPAHPLQCATLFCARVSALTCPVARPADMGHSLLAQYQMADFYVGDLPAVECVRDPDDSSDSEEDANSDSEDGEFVKVRSGAPHPSAPARQEVVNASDYKDPVERGIVPNRYRRRKPAGGAASDADAVARDSEGTHDPRTEAASRRPRPNSAPPLSRAATLRWWAFSVARVAKRVAERTLCDIWAQRRVILAAAAAALLALLASLVPLPPALLGGDGPDLAVGARGAPAAAPADAKEGGGVRGGPQEVGRGGAGARGGAAAPPRGHDPSERLYF